MGDICNSGFIAVLCVLSSSTLSARVKLHHIPSLLITVWHVTTPYVYIFLLNHLRHQIEL